MTREEDIKNSLWCALEGMKLSIYYTRMLLGLEDMVSRGTTTEEDKANFDRKFGSTATINDACVVASREWWIDRAVDQVGEPLVLQWLLEWEET